MKRTIRTPVRLLASAAAVLMLGLSPSFAQQQPMGQFQQPGQLSQFGTQSQMVQPQWSQFQGTQAGQIQGGPQAFVANANSLDKFEIAAAALAADVLQNEDLKSYPQSMLIEHAKNSQQLEGVALVNGIEAPPYLQQQQIQWLAILYNPNLTPRQFAEQYFDIMTRSQQIGAQLYQQEAQSGQNPDLRRFAQLKLPAMQQHLQDAQQIAQSFGVASIASPGQQFSQQGQFQPFQQ
jgi:putative membrane protein